MSEAILNLTMPLPAQGNVIAFPVQEKPLAILRDAIAELPGKDLPFIAGTLLALAIKALETGDQADFYDRTKSAFACLERVLQEGGRI